MKKLRFYAFAKATVCPIIKLCMRIKVTHREREYAGEGGLVVCANHLNMLDCLTLAIAFKRQIRFLGKKELFSIPILRNLFSMLGAYGVDRGGADVGAVKKTISILSDGATVGIFPQGTRCRGVNVEDTKFKNGAAMAAYHAHVPVQPVFIKTKNKKYQFLHRKEVIIGEVLTWDDMGFADGEHADYNRATEIIKERIVSLERSSAEKA